MGNDERLRALIDRWEDLREAGAEPSVEELCGDCPELAGQLRDWIETLKASDWLETPLVEAAISTNCVCEDSTHGLHLEPVEINEFIARLRASGLHPDEELEHVDGVTGQELGRQLIEQKKLTPYQAKCICRGETSHLILGEYVILGELGSGGMGKVFRAVHRTMNRPVAVKTLPPSITKSEQAVRLFQREIQVIARLAHPNIATAYDAGQSNDVHFLAMELVEGQDLAHVVRKNGPMSFEQAVDTALQAARGLAYTHESGVVHRDIKPSNLCFDANGTVKILDLGVARLRPGELDSVEEADGPTGRSHIVGTVDFMAPEQAFDARHADHRADIYSLGCTLYFLLTGKRPYDGESPMERLLAHKEKPIPSLTAARPDAPTLLEHAFRKMVAKDPANRYQSMEEVIGALEACSASQSSGGGRRSWWLLATAGIGFVVSLFWLASIVLKVETPRGTVVIEVDQPEAEVHIDGEKRLSVKDPPGGEDVEVRLKVGEHVRSSRNNGREEDTAHILVTSSENEVVRVHLEPLPPNDLPGKSTPFALEGPDPQRVAAKWVLDSGGWIEVSFGGGRREITRTADLPDERIIVVQAAIQHDKSFMDEDLIHFKSFTSLQQGKLQGTSVTGTGVRYLPHRGVVRHLNLGQTAITDEGLEQIGKLDGLTALNIGLNRGFTDVGLRHLTALKGLRLLDLCNTKVTDEGLAHVGELTKLRWLSLHSTKVTNEGLVHLRNLGQLEDLNLIRTKITDEGLDHLRVLANLKDLDLPVAVTDEAVRKLKEEIPGCDINRDE